MFEELYNLLAAARIFSLLTSLQIFSGSFLILYGEAGFGEVGFGEVGFGEVGFAEVGFAEVGFGDGSFGEVGFGEAGSGFMIFFFIESFTILITSGITSVLGFSCMFCLFATLLFFSEYKSVLICK